jgi:arylsulfatase A-like enzyme
LISGLDWFPTFVTAAGDPNIVVELKAGKELNGQMYKVHLDGYDQTSMITGTGKSNRHEIWYFAESTLGAARIDDYKYTFKEQPGGWLGDTVTLGAPTITNLRLDPFERTAFYKGTNGSLEYFEWYKYEFWRFVLVQKKVAELAKSAIEFPPLQRGASFGLSAVKEQIEEAVRKHAQ